MTLHKDPRIFYTVFILLVVAMVIVSKIDNFLFAGAFALVCVIVLMKQVRNFVTNLVLLGSFLGIIYSYHFYFRVAFDLPMFNGSVLVFIGVFVVTRSIFLASQRIEIPIVSDLVKKVTK